MPIDSLFVQLGLVTIVSAGMAAAARALRQPILLGYIAAGIFLGVGGYNLVPSNNLTDDFAKIGIVFLLFLIGLELNVSQVKRVGRVVVITGLIQMLTVSALTAAVTVWLGYSTNLAIFLGLAAAFSSTAVVLKRLVDRRELASLHARISVGILLLQDVIAILALMFISGAGRGSFDALVFAGFALKGVAFLIATWLVTKYLLGKIFYHIAKSTELLFLTSIGWAFAFAMISDALGFSKEIGAFIAGISLATLPYNLEIIGRVKPLKDFFLIIFFVMLGLEISWPVIAENFRLILAISVLVLLVKTFVTAVVMVRQGYPKRPAYLTGAGLGQMSEFSLLVVLLGASLGQVNEEAVALTAALLVTTIILNTYWLHLNRVVYPILVKPLAWFGGRVRQRELRYRPAKLADHVLMFGANRTGYAILKTLEKYDGDVLVIDHNPEVIRRLLRRGVQSVYGDIDDYELIHEMGLNNAKMVISTVPHATANLYLIKHTKEHNPHALVITTADQIESALSMYAAGADYVILPHLIGGEHAAQLLEGVEAHLLNRKQIEKSKEKHIRHLKERRVELSV